MGSTSSSPMESSPSTGRSSIILQPRSEGDGMENVPVPATETISPLSPKCQKIPLRATKTTYSGSSGSNTAVKRKEPKFVPYEPYKAAVSPKIPLTKARSPSVSRKQNGINEIKSSQLCYEHMSESSIRNAKSLHIDCKQSFQKVNGEGQEISPKQIDPCLWLQEKVILENKISSLLSEMKELKTQFNVQTKVNADLKKLLVASLGEDIQTKVQYMSEDKAKLGEHVLYYSEQLNQNHEELDKLSVQCDIWKSKFEASSLLVDELAGWKVVLSRSLSEATEATRCLLNEHKEAHNQITETFRLLHHIQESINPSSKRDIPCSDSPWNLLQLAGATRSLSEDIQSRLVSNIANVTTSKIRVLENTNHFTHGEQLAKKILANLENLPEMTKSEVNRKALKCPGIQACSILPHSCSGETTVNCCGHCSGEIHLV